MAPTSTRSATSRRSKLEEEEDGVNGERMKSLESVCLSSPVGRKPLTPLVQCGSSRSKRAAEDSGKENVAPVKKKQASSPLLNGVTKFLETPEDQGDGALDVLLLAMKNENGAPRPQVDERKMETDALKRFTRLRSSLVSSSRKRAGDRVDSKTLEEASVVQEEEKSDKFTVCLTSTQDIHELPLLDKAEAISAREEEVAKVRGQSDCDQDVSLRLSVGVKQEATQEPRLSLEETRRLLRSSSRSEAAHLEHGKELEALVGTALFPAAAVKVAANWLDLLQNDLKGRLAALKRSRRNVRGVILSGQFWKRGVSKYEVRDAELEKWKSMFQTMDAGLAAEGAKLEHRLRQLQEMQKHCQSEPEADPRRVSHLSHNQSSSSRNVELLASAAAICSTADFGLRNNTAT